MFASDTLTSQQQTIVSDFFEKGVLPSDFFENKKNEVAPCSQVIKERAKTFDFKGLDVSVLQTMQNTLARRQEWANWFTMNTTLSAEINEKSSSLPTEGDQSGDDNDDDDDDESIISNSKRVVALSSEEGSRMLEEQKQNEYRGCFDNVGRSQSDQQKEVVEIPEFAQWKDIAKGMFSKSTAEGFGMKPFPSVGQLLQGDGGWLTITKQLKTANANVSMKMQALDNQGNFNIVDVDVSSPEELISAMINYLKLDLSSLEGDDLNRACAKIYNAALAYHRIATSSDDKVWDPYMELYNTLQADYGRGEVKNIATRALAEKVKPINKPQMRQGREPIAEIKTSKRSSDSMEVVSTIPLLAEWKDIAKSMFSKSAAEKFGIQPFPAVGRLLQGEGGWATITNELKQGSVSLFLLGVQKKAVINSCEELVQKMSQALQLDISGLENDALNIACAQIYNAALAYHRIASREVDDPTKGYEALRNTLQAQHGQTGKIKEEASGHLKSRNDQKQTPKQRSEGDPQNSAEEKRIPAPVKAETSKRKKTSEPALPENAKGWQKLADLAVTENPSSFMSATPEGRFAAAVKKRFDDARFSTAETPRSMHEILQKSIKDSGVTKDELLRNKRSDGSLFKLLTAMSQKAEAEVTALQTERFNMAKTSESSLVLFGKGRGSKAAALTSEQQRVTILAQAVEARNIYVHDSAHNGYAWNSPEFKFIEKVLELCAEKGVDMLKIYEQALEAAGQSTIWKPTKSASDGENLLGNLVACVDALSQPSSTLSAARR